MPFRNIDMSAAMTRLAENRIEAAMEEGKFDNLPGAGKPIDLDPLPPDENARLMWWAMRLFKHNDVIPDEVRYRKRIHVLKSELAHTRNEERVRTLVVVINELVHKLNTLGTNVRASDISPVSLEAELAACRTRQR